MPALTTKRRILKPLPQVGIIKDIHADIARKALQPGKRTSKTGKEYWETRRNRSDRLGQRV